MKLTAIERRAIFSLSGIFALRMFGLFLVLPVLAIYAIGYEGSTPLLVGTALGIYGLTQAMLQLPFGLLSDRFGRKPLITIGLILLALGSVVAALATDIVGLIIGRAIQGAGAISAVVLALTADFTRDEQRTRAMAMIGMSIGIVFLLSMSIAPPLAERVGMSGLFWLIAILAVLAIGLLHTAVPRVAEQQLHRDLQPVRSQLAGVLRDAVLLRLYVGIFILHLVLAALFVVLPGELIRLGNLPVASHWKVYTPIIVASVVGMIPLVLFGSRQHLVRPMLLLTGAVLAVALVLLALVVNGSSSTAWVALLIGVWLFLVAFNGLEAMLPSLVSRVAPAAAKGSAIGVFNTFQFGGIFAGGVAGGLLVQQFGPAGVFWVCVLATFAWLVLLLVGPGFRLLSTRVVRLSPGAISPESAMVDRIRAVAGVQEVTTFQGEPYLYLKVDDRELDTAALDALLAET